MIRQDIKTYLGAFAGLTALVAQRIYLSVIPPSETPYANLPAVVFRRANGGHEHDLDGAAGYAAPDFEFHVIGRRATDVEAICEQLRLALQGYRGTMGSSTIQRCTLEDESDDYFESETGDDVGFYRTVLRYTIGYTETIPSFS